MVNNIVVPNAMVFQYMVTITEIVLGVAFILGLFTFIAAAISVVMNINFLLSTGLYDYWFLMTSIAMMAGAGRAFGLDYYVYPYLQRQWRYLVRNRRPKVFLFR
jgi:NADH dehydrogenase